MRSITFNPAPGECAPVLVTHMASTAQAPALWQAIREDIADRFGCLEEDLSIEEVVWDDGDRSAEFVELSGRLIGSIDEHLTVQDWRDVFDERCGTAFKIAAE